MKLKIYALAVIVFQLATIANGQIELVKDINPLNYVSGPTGGIAYKGFIYYQGNDDITGFELWRTDGTLDGTSLFKDLNPGGNSFPGSFIIFNDILYFSAGNASGTELWRTDGTPAGTYMLTDINIGSGSANPQDLTIVNDKLFFRATTPDFGTELWVTDGTSEGTRLVKDIYAGTASSNNTDGITFAAGESIAAFNGYAYFYADDGTPGAELWRTDGTTTGTELVKDMNDTVAETFIAFIVEVNSRLVLGALVEHTVRLWTSDGTTTGTETLGNLGVWGSGNQYPTSRNILHNYLFFSAVNLDDGADNINNELWRTDGTLANTQQVAEISSDPSVGSVVMNMIATDSEIYFAARTNNDPASSKLALCKSNGSIGNFTVIDESFVAGYPPTNMAFYNGKLYFSAARDYTVLEQFFTYDGSTVTSYNLPLPSTVYSTNFFIVLNGNLFFDSSGLIKFDGTTPTRIGSNSYHSSNPTAFTDAGNGITYFVADDGTNGAELWRTDGTSSGTSMVKNINPSGGSLLREFKMFNATLYFVADDGAHGLELWKSDGTETGTVLAADINPGTPDSSPNSLTVFGNELYFAAQGGLWKIGGDGLPVLVKNVSVSPGSLTVSAPYLFFAAYDSDINKCALFKTDGTESGTFIVSDNLPGCFGSNTEISDLGVLNSKVYFPGLSANFQSELWVYDGTTSAPVKPYVDGGPGQPGNFTVIDNTLFFGAADATHGYELWKTDGTSANTVMVKDINAGTATSLYTPPQHGPPFAPRFNRISFDNKLFFTANDGSHGYEVWTTDGTDAGTYMLNDLAPGSLSGGATNFTVLDSSLYFLASDGNPEFHPEVFVTNGSSCGTRKVSSSPYITSNAQSLMVSGSKLFVSLKDEKRGQELFTIDPSQIQAPPAGCGSPQEDPITQPTSLMFSTVTDNSIFLSFTASSKPGAGYITLMRAYGSPYPEDVPVDGTVYQVGNVIGSSTIVVGMGTQTSFNVVYLNPETTYYFDVFAYDVNHNYLTINPLAGNQTTIEQTIAPPSSLSFSNVTSNSMDVSFTALDPAPDGYVAVMQAFSSPGIVGAPQNGTTYHVGDLIGGSTIVVGFGNATSLNIVYLNADTEYFFNVYPYTQNADSYTYVTTNPLWGSQRTSGSTNMMARKDEQPTPYPNPFTDALTIPFETKNDNTPIRIVIYDQVGRLIADVVNTTFDKGNHEVQWDRTDSQGNKVKEGLYVYHLKTLDSGSVKQGFVVAK